MTASLRDRAASAEVATQDRAPQQVTLAGQIQAMQDQFALAMPKGAEAQQLVRDAITALRTTRNLGVAEPSSVLGALMNCAQLGLRVGVLGQAWVLPYWDRHLENGRGGKGGYRAQLIVGYQGLIELAHRSGKVASLIARTVHEHDTFEIEYGLEDRLVHRPAMGKDRGDPVAYYAVVKLTTGGHAFWVMSQSDMEAHRDKHAPRNKSQQVVGPWRDHFEPMAWKTVLKQLFRWVPKSTELATAMTVDETVRVDATPDVTPIEASHHVTIEPGADDADLPVEDPPASAEYDPTTEPGFGQGGDV